jgi:beta-galactosidase
MKNIIKSILVLFLLFIVTDSANASVNAQIPDSSTLKFPFIGAQVFIEPGQTPEEIDTWFRVLKENQFTVCRIRMFESYMRKADGTWDFSLFDNASSGRVLTYSPPWWG